jgi:hypothetical protein
MLMRNETMAKVVTTNELKKNTETVIDWARAGDEAIIVEAYGQPTVAILSFDEYQDYLKYKEKQQARIVRFERLRQLAEQNATYGLSEAEAVSLAEEAREEVHQLRQGKNLKSS